MAAAPPCLREPAVADAFTAAARRLGRASVPPMVEPVARAGGTVWLAVASVALAAVAGVLVARNAAGAARPCTRVPYAVDARRAPPGAEGDVRAAFGRVSRLTGMRFVAASRDLAGGRVLRVAWVDAADEPEFARGRAVVAYAAARWEDGRFADGYIHFNVQERLASGFGGRMTTGVVALHEIGHVLGLEHSSDPGDVMFPGPAGATAWSARELRLLRDAGGLAGCVR